MKLSKEFKVGLVAIVTIAIFIWGFNYLKGLDVVTVNLDPGVVWPLMAAMVTGSLALSLLASLGAAITVGLRQGGLLVSLLILPLYVPVMIFGVLSTSGFQTGIDNSGTSLLILAAIVLVALVVSPFASAAALRSYLR